MKVSTNIVQILTNCYTVFIFKNISDYDSINIIAYHIRDAPSIPHTNYCRFPNVSNRVVGLTARKCIDSSPNTLDVARNSYSKRYRG